MKRKECPKCHSHLVKEIKDSEVFGVTDKHVYSRIEKGILCLVCGYRKTDWGIR